MKKKIVSLLLCMIMAASMLAGCGSKTVDATNDKVVSSESDVSSKDDIVDVETSDSAEEEDIVDIVEISDSEEPSEPEDEYLTINSSTLCSGELYDFFKLYLYCWTNVGVGNSDKAPENIRNLLDNAGLGVGASIFDMIVSDYSDENFIGLDNARDGVHGIAGGMDSVNYSCSVRSELSNFGHNYKYKKGTDAELKMIVSVTYNISGTWKRGLRTNQDSDKTVTSNYAVTLVNNINNPEKWLLKEIYWANYNEASDICDVYARTNYTNPVKWGSWAKELFNEDVEVIAEDSDWKEIIEAYKNYAADITTSMLKQYNFIYLNNDNIPDLLITTDYQLNCRTLLTYVDGKIYACEIDSNYGFYYKEFGNSICYGEIDTSTENLLITMHLADFVDFNLVEKFSGEYYEETGVKLYSIEGVDCSGDEYYRKFGFGDMKDGLYTMYNSIEEAFHALNLQFTVVHKIQGIMMCSNVDYHVCKRAGLAEMSDFSFCSKISCVVFSQSDGCLDKCFFE